MRSISARPTLLIFLAGILWSFSGVLIKSIHWDFFRVAGVRSLIGGLIQLAFLAAFIRRDNQSLSFNGSLSRAVKRLFTKNGPHWLGASLFVINMLALAWAFRLTNATNAVFLHYSGMLLVALVSCPILRQKLQKQDWIAVGCATIGIFIFCLDGFQLNTSLGTWLGVLCGFTFAGCQVCLGLRAQQEGGSHKAALETIILANFLTVLLTAPVILANLNDLPSPHDWLLLLLLGVFPWGLPDVMYAVAIEAVPIFRALIIGLLDPILTAVWPCLLLREYPTALAIGGSLIVLGAIVYQAGISQRHK